MEKTELCDRLKGHYVMKMCEECLNEYSGYDPFCTAYASDKTREEDNKELMRDLGYE